MSLRVYLDTNILIQSGWPGTGTRLRELLTLARMFQIPVVIPEPVEREHKAHWLRHVNKLFQKLADLEDSLFRELESVLDHIDPTHQDLVELDLPGNYSKAVEQLRQEWRISSAPFPSVPIDVVFDLAIQHQLPFQDEGKGFQDMTVLLSVIDDVLRLPGCTGMLVTEDGDFHRDEVRAFLADRAVDLTIHRSLDAILTQLRERLEDHIREDWDREERVAAASLYRAKPGIEKFILRSLANLPSWVTARFEGPVEQIVRVELVSCL